MLILKNKIHSDYYNVTSLMTKTMKSWVERYVYIYTGRRPIKDMSYSHILDIGDLLVHHK